MLSLALLAELPPVQKINKLQWINLNTTLRLYVYLVVSCLKVVRQNGMHFSSPVFLIHAQPTRPRWLKKSNNIWWSSSAVNYLQPPRAPLSGTVKLSPYTMCSSVRSETAKGKTKEALNCAMQTFLKLNLLLMPSSLSPSLLRNVHIGSPFPTGNATTHIC
jgi:hypothetical protein